jgi:hypothetical protein
LVHVVEVSGEKDIGGDILLLPAREITHRPLIESCAFSGLPLLLCTAGASLKEITRAVSWHRLAFSLRPVAAPHGRVQVESGDRIIPVHGGENLRAMARIAAQTFTPVGYEGDNGALALAAGAVLLIRDAGPGFSEWAAEIREAERLLGESSVSGDAGAHVERRSIVAARAIKRGCILSRDDVRFEAPAPAAGGFAPYQLEDALRRELKRDLDPGEPLLESHLEGAPPQPAVWFSPRPPKAPPG